MKTDFLEFQQEQMRTGIMDQGQVGHYADMRCVGKSDQMIDQLSPQHSLMMEGSSIILVLVVVLVVILGGGQQAGDVADAFGDALPEEQLGAQAQVLGVFDEAETNDGPLACAQLLLQQKREVRRRAHTQAREPVTCSVISATFP